MGNTSKTDIELMDYMLNIMYNDNHYQYVNVEVFLEELKEAHGWDVKRIFRKLQDSGFISLKNAATGLSQLSDKGMEIMRIYKSYSAYLKHLDEEDKKKKKSEKIDRNIKNGNIVAVVLISLMTLILTQCPISNKQKQSKTEEDIQSLAKEIDSLKQVLQNTQQLQKNRLIKDTATDK
jgi:hypothetical protein